jgi:arsenite methyltransferase
MANPLDADKVRQTVRDGYADIALKGSERRQPSCCAGMCDVDAEKLARQIGYSSEELAALPDGANIGLSCGNPNALAALRPGEVLLDLGSGAGFDAFVAGPKVGATGRVIGVDMTPEMLSKARKNITTYRDRTGLDNVEFRLGEIEHLPVADASVDAVISNCVINLSPDKPQVWREIARVLKPGGRVAVSDLALLKPLPSGVAEMVEALVGCVAGAVLVDESGRMAHDAGLTNIQLNPKPGYVEALVDGQDPLYVKIMAQLPAGAKPGDYVTSLEITARKLASVAQEAASTLAVYDPAMCCSTGVCGPDVDPKLVQFAADLDWVKSQGVLVQRHNLAQNPAAFVENELVRTTLMDKGEAGLPLLAINGQIAVMGRYPKREELAALLTLKATAESAPARVTCCCGGAC